MNTVNTLYLFIDVSTSAAVVKATLYKVGPIFFFNYFHSFFGLHTGPPELFLTYYLNTKCSPSNNVTKLNRSNKYLIYAFYE